MNFEDYESLPGANVLSHMTAGAIAGIMEHCVMYPLDSVKTRMQSLAPTAGRDGVSGTLLRMVRTEGLLRPVKGMSAVVMGAGPSHALYFSCYEYLKDTMIQKSTTTRYHTAIYGASGCVATLLHDGIMNPAEVIKQRLQMYNTPYKSVADCMRRVYQTEGPKAFYRSYTTQLTMNIPFQSIHFMTYEVMQKMTNKDKTYNPAAHMFSGAIAGAVAAAATTPLDVCKTLLNTQQNAKAKGLVEACATVYRLGGPMGFFRGMQARVMYQMPATAICWSTYEFFKYLLITTRMEDVLAQEAASEVIKSDKESSPPHTTETIALKPRELPTVSGAGLYGAISFNTIHHGADTNLNCSRRIKDNPILDITHT